MMKKRCSIVLSIVVISIFLCSGSFAQNITLPSSRGGWVLEYKPLWSNWAITELNARFDEAITYLEGIANSVEEPHKSWINNNIALIESSRDKIDGIDIYLVQAESSPGEAFDDVFDYFKEDESYWLVEVEDVEIKKGKAEQKVQDVQGQSLEEAIMAIPTPIISVEIKNELIERIEGDIVRVARGKKEPRRISILTVYINPDTSEILDGTTVVIATDVP